MRLNFIQLCKMKTQLYLSKISGLLCLILITFLLGSTAFALESQDKISAKVICALTGHPISGAHITASSGTAIAVTNASGTFTLDKNSLDVDDSIYISHVNFHSLKVSLHSILNGNSSIIQLSPKQHDLRPVTVISHRTLEQPLDFLRTTDVAFKPIDSGAFLLSAANVSGVRRGGFGMDPVVRGFANSRLNIRVDGLTSSAAACPNRMDPPTSHIRITDIERVEIHHGPHALQFGPSFGGTVNFVKHAKPQVEQFTVSGDVRGGIESNTGHRLTDARVSMATQSLDVLLSGGLSRTGDYSSGSGITVPAGFQSYDYGIDLGYRLTEAHRLQAGWSQSFVRDADFPALGMDMAVDDTYKLTLGYEFSPQQAGLLRQLNVNAYYNMVDHEMNNHNRESFAMRDAVALAETRSRGIQLKSTGLTNHGTWTVVSQYDQINIEGNRFVEFKMGPNTGNNMVYNLWQDSRISNVGLFAGTEQFMDAWTFSLGFRVDYNTADANDPAPRFQNRDLSSEYLNFSASAGVSNRLGQNSRISFYVGRGVRSPDITERFINFLAIGRNAFEFAGNPDLKPEANHQADLIFETRLNPVQLRANLFAAYTTDYISAAINPDMNPVGMNVPGVREFTNVGDAIFTGFELSALTSISQRWSAEIGASYTYAEYTDSGNPVAEIAPFETTFKLNGILFNRLSPMLSVRKVFPQSRIDEAFGEQRTSGFWLADVEMGYNIGFGMRLNAGVRNLFDEAYMEHLNRNFNPEVSPTQTKLEEPGRRIFVEFSYRF